MLDPHPTCQMEVVRTGSKWRLVGRNYWKIRWGRQTTVALLIRGYVIFQVTLGKHHPGYAVDTMFFEVVLFGFGISLVRHDKTEVLDHGRKTHP